MNFNYPLKYRSFDSVVEDIRVDFKMFNLEGKLDPQSLIKVALRINYDLGLRIQQSKEVVLAVEHGKARLPDDFTVMNFALICGNFTSREVLPQGTNIQEAPTPFNQNSYTNPFVPVYKNPQDPNACTDTPALACNQTPNTTTPPCLTPVCLTPCGAGYTLTQVIATSVRTYEQLMPVRFVNTQFTSDDCPNRRFNCRNEAYIKDGFVWTKGLDCANFYMNYEGSLQDIDGNLLVPDHPYINEYLEYGLKQRLLENLAMEGIDVKLQMSIVEPRYKAARNTALGFVNMPNFNEMQALWALNRKAMYNKYYDMFTSYGPGYGERFYLNKAV